MAAAPDATVVITTKDRREDLSAAIESALAQSGAEVEVLVVDDGSSDGTSDMVAERYPAVRLERSERSLGYIVQRTRAATLARAPVVVSIDDDARFTSPATVARTLADFDHERIGAVAIPFLDVRAHGTVERQVAPDGADRWITNVFVGTAHAVRRDLFLRLGGYRSALRHQGEEFDLCLRMLATGHVVRLGRAERIEHHESPRRATGALVRLAARNDVLRTAYLAPWPDAAADAAKQVVHHLAVGGRLGLRSAALRGIGEGLALAARTRDQRRPVGRGVMRADRTLRRRGPLPLSELEPLLPPVDVEAAGARISG
jgi:GT2 family glycosyltransferase